MPKSLRAFLRDPANPRPGGFGFPLAALLLAIGLAACSSTSESGREGGGEAPGEHGQGGESGESGESGEGGGGEESGTRLEPDQTHDMVHRGARLVLRYDPASRTFTGTVTNTLDVTLRGVRVEVHLSNGAELGPTAPMDLLPGRSRAVSLPAAGQNFASWAAHPENDGRATEIQTVTGMDAPAETPAAQRARSPGIAARADSLIVSTVYGETSLAELPTFQGRVVCSGVRCTLTEPTTGYSETVSVSDLDPPGAAEALGTKHGITVTYERDVADPTSFGAWMDHSAFGVNTSSFTEQGVRMDGRYGIAGGDLTGSAPSGNATWRGVMVGTPATGSERGERLQGDATLTFELAAGGTLDAAFTGIRNIDRLAPHATPAVRFEDVPVTAGGTFAAGLTGNRIQGGFYGPGHAETAGVFEQSNIVGAFGAKRR